MDDEEFLSIAFINEVPASPPTKRWYCYEHEPDEPSFATPEEGVEWAAPRFERVIVRPLTYVYYWVNKPPSEWEEEGAGPLRPWPPSDSERREIDRNYQATIERYAEAERLAPRLAEQIVRRVGPTLPDGWSLHAGSDWLVLKHRGQPYSTLAQVNGDLEQMYLGALDGVQSEISEETTDAWPHDPKRGMHMWEPEVRLADDSLHGWYGQEDDPVLSFEPISVDELRSS